jgi:hypothetical protein
MTEIAINVVLVAFGVGIAGFVAFMLWGAGDVIYRWAARVYRVYTGAAHEFDSDGIRQHRIPVHLEEHFDTHVYYVSPSTSHVMVAERSLGIHLNGREPIYCVAYSARADRVFVSRRTGGASRRIPRRVRKRSKSLDLEDYMAPLRLLDQHHNPWHYEATSVSIGSATPPIRTERASPARTAVPYWSG